MLDLPHQFDSALSQLLVKIFLLSNPYSMFSSAFIDP
jgi:hypothetical protein